MSFAASLLILVIAAAAATLGAIALLRPLERNAPAREPTRSAAWRNLKIWAPSIFSKLLGGSAPGVIVTLALNRAGTGLIALPDHGWGLLVAIAVYAAAMDFGEYLFHRAQHAIPALWALHSLHHSDETYDATTAVRHHWLDPLIKGVTVWLAVALLFDTPPMATFAYTLMTLWHFAVHANLKWSLGPAAWLLNTPHYHRSHHAADPRYFNANYASLFPIFDVLTGAYRPSARGDYPQTGLGVDQEPRTAFEIMAWPLKRLPFKVPFRQPQPIRADLAG